MNIVHWGYQRKINYKIGTFWGKVLLLHHTKRHEIAIKICQTVLLQRIKFEIIFLGFEENSYILVTLVLVRLLCLYSVLGKFS